ncbi:uncharacterized protein LOC122253913 [Penaeus japonicus]|uniref:uncharacterized protein LOC122253913 n=1 Tax=Penaeus japonicus TaxID=27405 RepID=UPI001C7150BB|nr:uncharacterized protein LOC122253913 [Penaeus japonicus]
MILKFGLAVALAVAAVLAPASLAEDSEAAAPPPTAAAPPAAKEEGQFAGERLVDETETKSLLQKNKFIFGSLSTTTYTGVAVSTSTVFFSCLLGTAATVCQGRRRRLKKSAKFAASAPFDDEATLDSSQAPATATTASAEDKQEGSTDELEEKSRFAFTAWTTSRTSTTVTVLFTNTSTTLRISLFCIAGFVQLPQFNCQTG